MMDITVPPELEERFRALLNAEAELKRVKASPACNRALGTYCDHYQALQARVAALEAALREIANVPVDGAGRDYYWQGRKIAEAALEGAPAPEPVNARLVTATTTARQALNDIVANAQKLGLLGTREWDELAGPVGIYDAIDDAGEAIDAAEQAGPSAVDAPQVYIKRDGTWLEFRDSKGRTALLHVETLAEKHQRGHLVPAVLRQWSADRRADKQGGDNDAD